MRVRESHWDVSEDGYLVQIESSSRHGYAMFWCKGYLVVASWRTRPSKEAATNIFELMKPLKILVSAIGRD